jgi:hypothetical protein
MRVRLSRLARTYGSRDAVAQAALSQVSSQSKIKANLEKQKRSTPEQPNRRAGTAPGIGGAGVWWTMDGWADWRWQLRKRMHD